MPGLPCPTGDLTIAARGESRSRRWPPASRMRMPRVALLAAIVVLVTGAAPGSWHAGLAAQPATPAAPAEPGPDPALIKAIDYVLSQQDDDGGFVGFTGEPDPGITVDAVFALKAAGQRGVDTTAAIDQALVYLEAEGGAYADIGPGQSAKLALAVIAGGKNPLDFGGVNLFEWLTTLPAIKSSAPQAAPVSLYGESVFNHALVLLAVAAANEPVPAEAIEVLRITQIEDGSWSFAATTDPGSGDSNTTALVIQALVATGHGADPMVDSALAYIQSVQNEQGQVLFQASRPEMADANSTALAVQAVIATGQDPASAEWANAAGGLAAFQNDSGGFRYVDAVPEDNLLATLQAVPALAGYTLPVATACDEAAAPAAISATPEIVALPAPGRGQAACVPLTPAA